MSGKIRQRLGPVSVPTYRRIHGKGERSTWTTSEESGSRTADVEVEIDLDVLRRVMGAQALRNKGARCVEVGGAVVVRVLTSTVTVEVKPHVHGERCSYQGELVCGVSP